MRAWEMPKNEESAINFGESFECERYYEIKGIEEQGEDFDLSF